MPYARVYLSDLMAECIARGLGPTERGILFTLLWVQHTDGGTIPANLRELRRRLAADVKDPELMAVVTHFFPLVGEGRRANPDHKEAYDAAVKAYTAARNRGHTTAAKRWAADSQTAS
jgi:uncharacterized protein YdaU (DUF1376 family)